MSDAATSGDVQIFAPSEGAGLGVLVVGQPVSDKVFDRLSNEGFTVMAVTGDTPSSDWGPGPLAALVDDLLAHPSVRGRGIGVLGFGSGAGLALAVAAMRPESVRAVVPVYEVPGAETPPSDGSNMADWSKVAAVEGHFPGNSEDPQARPVHDLEGMLESMGRDVRMFFYPGTTTGFFDAFDDDDAARQAWVRTLEFLRAKLG